MDKINQENGKRKPGKKPTKVNVKDQGKAERFAKILEHYALSGVEAARFFDESPQTINNWKNGILPYDKIYDKVKGTINPHWLLSGEGEMLIADQIQKTEALSRSVKDLETKVYALLKENEDLKSTNSAYKRVIQDMVENK